MEDDFEFPTSNGVEDNASDMDVNDIPEVSSVLKEGEEKEIGKKGCGLIKKLIKEGEGWENPNSGDEVEVHYVCTLLNGTQFDSSRDRGTPFKFKLGQGVSEEQIRGRELTTGNKDKKRRDQSRAGAEVSPLGQVVGEMYEKLEMVEFTFKTLETHVLEEIESVKGAVQEGLNSTEDRLEQLEDLVKGLQASIEGMREDLAICKRAIASGEASYSTLAPRVECPKPTSYNGVRDAEEVENFLWRMQQYFEVISLTDEPTKVKTASFYLSDTAMLWWRRKHDDIERGTCRIDTWEDFVRELKRQFYPKNVVYEARQKLRKLRQKGSIRDYVKEFTTLLLQIPDMTEDDSLFYFVDGLQHWAKQELQYRGVKSVDDAIVVAESLVEFCPSSSTDATKKKKKYPAKGGGDKRDNKNRDSRD